MADAFDKELEELVSRVATELSREITAVILRRLGITNAGRALATAPARARLAEAPRAPKPRGRPPSTMGPQAAPNPGPLRAPRKARTSGPRTRSSAAERADAIERVARIVEQSDGVGLGDIEKKSKLPRSAVQGALKALKDQGRAFMGGTKRFARYAKTQAEAERASLAARGG